MSLPPARLFPLTASLLSLFLVPLPARAQESAGRQALVPREVYVGDTAQLSYSFQSSADLYALVGSGTRASRIEGGILYIDISDGYFSPMEPACSVTQLSLRQVGTTYTLVLHFVPWRTGRIAFISLDMERLFSLQAGGVIMLEPVEVLSLSEKLGTTTLRPPAPPLLLPGTKYIVWSLIVVLVLLLIMLAVFAMNFSAFVRRTVLLRERIGYRRNAFRSRRRLRGLLRPELSDADFAQRWQQLMRSYLDYRFGASFLSITSKDIALTVARATGDMLDIEQENAVLSIQSLFIRTDYIRYAKDSPDSRKLPLQDHEAAFAGGEKERVVELSLVAISELERDKEEFKAYGRV